MTVNFYDAVSTTPLYGETGCALIHYYWKSKAGSSTHDKSSSDPEKKTDYKHKKQKVWPYIYPSQTLAYGL